MGQHQQHGRRKADQPQRLQSDRLALQVAVEADQPARERGDAETQYDFALERDEFRFVIALRLFVCA
jgi:hypothetical protein